MQLFGGMPALQKLVSNSDWLRYLVMRRYWEKGKRGMRLSDVEYVHKQYTEAYGHDFDLEHPRNFDEKLMFLKVSLRDPMMTRCSDKYLAREYVRECGLSDILIEQYGVYKSPHDIDFDSLPSPCYIKCNHLSGGNMVFDRSSRFNRRIFNKRYAYLLRSNYYIWDREWSYKDIAPLLIVEKKLEPRDGMLYVYSFYCFKGELFFCRLTTDCADEWGNKDDHSVRCATLDGNGEYLEVTSGLSSLAIDRSSFVLPACYADMKVYAEKLAAPFRFVRVDFYVADERPYFSELTFYPNGGLMQFTPAEWNERMGELLDISGLTIAEDAYQRGCGIVMP